MDIIISILLILLLPNSYYCGLQLHKMRRPIWAYILYIIGTIIGIFGIIFLMVSLDILTIK
jgi:hypothetical protein